MISVIYEANFKLSLLLTVITKVGCYALMRGLFLKYFLCKDKISININAKIVAIMDAFLQTFYFKLL